MSAVAERLITAGELLLMPDTAGKQELVAGRIVTMPPVSDGHGITQLGLGAHLRQFVRQRALGEIAVEVGFILRRNPDTVRGPDIAFIAAGRLRAQPTGNAYREGPPDLAVEIISPNDRATEVEEKVQEYLDAGTRLVWTVNARTRTVTVYYPDGMARVLRGDDVLDGADTLPGFAIRVEDVFTL